jgi:FlaA1/EpsC-like NDP-sugar epimerase
MTPVFAGKSVLVTGAGGSIGSQLCDLVARQGAHKLTLVSLTENGLYTIDRQLRARYGNRIEIRPVLGSVGQACLMENALQGVDVVVHAAAHKHVPMCQQNPAEAIRNNVFGTRTLAELSLEAGVQSFCMISSDKAVLPASIMGATKRLAEMIVAECGRISTTTRFLTVRFGNVLDSAGSVLPLWREQIRAGGPLTLTDERCERYFMSIPDAVGLVVSVIGQGEQGTFVLEMGAPRRLVDLARELMRDMGRVVPIQCIGLRPGEKLTEELHHGGELIPTRVPGVHQVIGDDPGRISAEAMLELEMACAGCDQDEAVALLWSLVR